MCAEIRLLTSVAAVWPCWMKHEKRLTFMWFSGNTRWRRRIRGATAQEVSIHGKALNLRLKGSRMEQQAKEVDGLTHGQMPTWKCLETLSIPVEEEVRAVVLVDLVREVEAEMPRNCKWWGLEVTHAHLWLAKRRKLRKATCVAWKSKRFPRERRMTTKSLFLAPYSDI